MTSAREYFRNNSLLDINICSSCRQWRHIVHGQHRSTMSPSLANFGAFSSLLYATTSSGRTASLRKWSQPTIIQNQEYRWIPITHSIAIRTAAEYNNHRNCTETNIPSLGNRLPTRANFAHQQFEWRTAATFHILLLAVLPLSVVVFLKFALKRQQSTQTRSICRRVFFGFHLPRHRI
jgi:hypothetical protein